MNDLHERRVSIDSGSITLEAALHEGGDGLAAIVLHPHTQYGGDMDNHVVTGLCSAIASEGGTILRLNFRGAGSSGGDFDHGRGEVEDAKSGVAFLRKLRPDAALIIAGYSFGAMVAASAAPAADPQAILLVSPPARGLSELPERVPALLVTGANDRIAPADALRTLEAPGRRVVVVPAADHSWWPGLDALLVEVRSFVDTLSA